MCRRKTKIFWESLPSKTYLTPASERQKSLAKEQYAEELTEKLLATLNRRSLIGETDEHGDLIELMPVRDSFNADHLDGESNENNIVHSKPLTIYMNLYELLFVVYSSEPNR